MGRKYVRVNRHIRNGKNHVPYNSFSKEDLDIAMELVKSKEMTIRSAAKHFNIPKSTLARHCKTHDKLQERAGRPTLFSREEEDIFVDYCLLLSEWGFPLDKMDLRVFAQRYLNKIGKTIPTLKDNLPGPDWAQNFIERHQDRLSNRLAANISSARAKTTAADIDNFFENFSESMRGVKPENLINFDETNLTDDPGAKKYIFKRGTKYPERIINNSKTAISVMFSGAANGEILTLYVVYKAEHLWDQWMTGKNAI